jgi:hypothetical protein
MQAEGGGITDAGEPAREVDHMRIGCLAQRTERRVRPP